MRGVLSRLIGKRDVRKSEEWQETAAPGRSVEPSCDACTECAVQAASGSGLTAQFGSEPGFRSESVADSETGTRAGADAESTTVPASFASDAGMSTVEYAIGTVVAAAFAAVLYRIVTGDSIVAALTELVSSALSPTF
jgi:hypothetical protein